MSGLEDLYREILLDHYRNPRHRGELEVPPAIRAEGFNPLCGDEVIVYVDVDPDDVVQAVAIGGQGCSISQSSASMMAAGIKGRQVTEVRRLVRAFKSMMSIHSHEIGGDEEDDDNGSGDGEDGSGNVKLGDLEALRGVVKFPVRIKCATLSWNTLIQALDEAIHP